MHIRRNQVIVIVSVVALALIAAAALAFSLGLGGSGPSSSSAQSPPARSQGAPRHVIQAAPAGFGWFHPGPAPGSWRQTSATGLGGVLFYPRSLQSMQADRGAVTVGLSTRTGAALVYLNVTPRQGGETLQNWPGFRLSHLREDGEYQVRLDAMSPSLSFQGGQGRCVVDDYTSKVHNNHYREIACFVTGAHGGSVIIAATRAVTWAQYGTLLERVVSGYVAK